MTGERDLRLVSSHRRTDQENKFLIELFKLDDGVKAALQDLNHALLHNDVEAGIRAARRFTSLGVLMDAAQKKVVGL